MKIFPQFPARNPAGGRTERAGYPREGKLIQRKTAVAGNIVEGNLQCKPAHHQREHFHLLVLPWRNTEHSSMTPTWTVCLFFTAYRTLLNWKAWAYF